MDEAEELNESLVILETKWKGIAARWKEKKEPLNDGEKTGLRENLATLQKLLASLHAVKTLLKTLGQIRKALFQVQNRMEENVDKNYSLDIIASEIIKFEKRRDEINKTMFDMYVDDFFIKKYVTLIDDYRVASLPLPCGFMCHIAYQTELDFIKASISETEEDLNARREMLAETQPMDTDQNDHGIMSSINGGMDHLKMLRAKLYQILNETKPISTKVFHTQCQALIKEKMNVLEQIKRLQILKENELLKMY